MANTFITPDDVVRDAAIILADNLSAANLVQRNIEDKFAEKVGKTVKVKTIPDLGAANEFSGSTSATNITETNREITLEKHFYQRVTLTDDERTFELDDFVRVVAAPCALSLAESVDSYMIDMMSEVFARNLVGTAGSSPTTVAHILAGRKKIMDNRGTYRNVAGIIDTTAEQALLQVTQFISADYGPERPMALREGALGRLHGATWFTSQNADAHARGDVAGTVLVNGASQTGATLAVDGFTASSGTVNRGTRFTIASVAGTYTVAADATIASNAATLTLVETLASSPADNAAITFEAANKANLLYNTQAVYGAVVAPAPFRDGSSAIASMNGLSVRASFFKSASGLAEDFVLDVYCGCEVIHPSSGVVFQGA